VTVAAPATGAFDDPHFRMELTPLGRYMLEFRYLQHRPDGTRETPEELFRRVAANLAGAEASFGAGPQAVASWTRRFFDLMTDRRYLPNAPTLLGAGTDLQQLHACFVLPVGDSVDEVFDAVRMAAVVHARGGGTGFSFSGLRHAGAPVSTGGRATGPVPLLRVFDIETDVIKSGGTGWGANMGVLRCDHPDIARFVSAKAGGSLRNFNLSVGVTGAFLRAVQAGETLALRDPRTGEPVDEVDAGALFRSMCEQAWRTGDPGLLFLDRIEADNPVPGLGRLEATNPCGEAPLLPFEACCLGGINVARFATPGAGDGVDWAGIDETAALALRMMDNTIESSNYPLESIRLATLRTRKVGIGVMGFADLCIELGIPYGTDAAVVLARRLMERIADATRMASADLALERGNFPAFDGSVWRDLGFASMRNATTTSNAPNSTIGPIAGCSPGIEPLFAVGYERILANGDRNREIHPRFVALLEERGLAGEALLAAVQRAGSVRDVDGVPDDLRRLFVTAHDVDPADHVRIQAAFQAATDLGVSKTVNLPNEASVDDVAALFLLAHELGCKGTTVFRDGCRDDRFLVAGTGEDGRGDRDGPAADERCEVCS